LEQAVGEPTAALAHVKATLTCGIDTSMLQGTFQLQAAPRNIAGFCCVQQLQFHRLAKLFAVFRHSLPGRLAQAPTHARSDQPLRLGARRSQAALDK
jgi:hypothetical protein